MCSPPRVSKTSRDRGRVPGWAGLKQSRPGRQGSARRAPGYSSHCRLFLFVSHSQASDLLDLDLSDLSLSDLSDLDLSE